ncbi:MAG: hypothetical protein FWC28_08940 [Proteobacteria bacterium]|nr:hypothetical protein [Cystobacterineae bacterium]MCL2258325.1 hypothetical protein [Cystobacterineae bacterium]MCL2315350.1 hypothetical protein [Pseudomonadota bacterium]
MKLLCSAALLLGLACTAPLPGVVDVGLFDFSASAVLIEAECRPDMADESGFRFKGRFRLESNLSDGYFIYGSIHRAAQFDGQNMVSVYVAERSFVSGCEVCNIDVVETLNVVLLSKTQNELLDGQCPRRAWVEGIFAEGGGSEPFVGFAPNELEAAHACGVALREGIPVADGESISLPGLIQDGFDAVRACGTLVAHMVATPAEQGCPEDCYKEDVVYYIEGIRKE